MADRIDLKRIEQRVWRAAQQDGLLEVMIGLLLVLTSAYWAKPVLAAPVALFPVFGWRILELARKRFTYPRIGYVELIQEDPKHTLRGIAIYVLIVFVAMALILLLVGEIGDIDTWLRWLPALTGVVLSGGFIYAAGKSGAFRYYLFVVLAVGLGIALSLLPVPHYRVRMLLYMLSLGATFLVWGLVMFLRFLRRYPVQQGGTPDANV